MKMSKILAIVLVLCMCVCLMAGCGEKAEAPTDNGGATAFTGKDIDNDPIKLAYISISSAGVTNVAVETAFAETLSMYKNVTLNYFDGEYNPTTQINAVQECITQQYDCILIEPLDGEALVSAVTEAEQAGIPVISINPGINCVHSAHIQGDDYHSGEQAAQILYEKLGGGQNYIILDCPSGAKASTRMGTGFEDWLTTNTDWTKIDHQYIDAFSMEIANTTMSDLLTKYDDIDVVYGAIDDIAIGASQAVQAAGRDGIYIFGNTGYPNGFQAIKDGAMYGTSWCDTYSEYQAVVAMALFFIKTGFTSAKAGLTETPTINCSLIGVTQENVDTIYPISRWGYYGA